MENQYIIWQINNQIELIKDSLLNASPEALKKIETALEFAVYQMDSYDAINAEIIA